MMSKNEIDKMKETTIIDKTEETLLDMMTESTGRHFLDSGGAYRRGWEMNQKLGREAIKKQPDIRINYDYPSISLYQYLYSHLTINDKSDKIQKKFDEFAELEENKSKNWFEIVNKFSNSRNTINTYNNENILSQDIQYTVLGKQEDDEDDEDDEDNDYILLMIHQGCDIRGGYTEPKVFKTESLDAFVCDVADFSIHNVDYNVCFDSHSSYISSSGNESEKEEKSIKYDDGVAMCTISLNTNTRINAHYGSIVKILYAKLRRKLKKPISVEIELEPYVCWDW